MGHQDDYLNNQTKEFRMNNATKITGLAIAAAAAAMFMVAPAANAAKHEGNVHCTGLNACKGKSDCKTASNACKGMNACKGKGMNVMSEKDCTAKGGKVEK
jgi:hypothetical protein